MMKPLVPILCVVAGIAIGWFANPPKPASVQAPAVVAAPASAPAQKPTADQAGHAEVHATVIEAGGKGKKPKTPGKASEAGEEAGKKQLKLLGKKMADMQRAKFEARLAKLATDLKLTPEQQGQLRATMEKRYAAMEEMYNPDRDRSVDAGTGILELMNSDGVDTALAGVLTDEQKTGYTAFKAKERQARVEGVALKNLASVTGALELTDDQRDGVYQVLSEQAAAREDAKKPMGLDAGAMMEGMGIQMDDELGFGGFTGLAIAQSDAYAAEAMAAAKEGRKPVKQSSAAARKTLIKNRVDSMVDSMRPHLTEPQLQQYRAHLESKAASMTAMVTGFGTTGENEDE